MPNGQFIIGWSSFMITDVYLQLKKRGVTGGYVVVSWSQLYSYW